MEDEARMYRSYVLRLWPVKVNGGWAWRSSLEETGTGARWSFADLETLVTFLRAETVETPVELEE